MRKPFNKLKIGEEFYITKNGPILMKLGDRMFRGVYLTGRRKGQTWNPKTYVGQRVYIGIREG